MAGFGAQPRQTLPSDNAATRVDKAKVVAHLRRIAQESYDNRLYETSIFYASKLVSMNAQNDVSSVKGVLPAF